MIAEYLLELSDDSGLRLSFIATPGLGMAMRRTLKKKQNDIFLCWCFSFLFGALRHTSGWLLLVIELAVAPQRECSGFYRGPPTDSASERSFLCQWQT